SVLPDKEHEALKGDLLAALTDEAEQHPEASLRFDVSGEGDGGVVADVIFELQIDSEGGVVTHATLDLEGRDSHGVFVVRAEAWAAAVVDGTSHETSALIEQAFTSLAETLIDQLVVDARALMSDEP